MSGPIAAPKARLACTCIWRMLVARASRNLSALSTIDCTTLVLTSVAALPHHRVPAVGTTHRLRARREHAVTHNQFEAGDLPPTAYPKSCLHSRANSSRRRAAPAPSSRVPQFIPRPNMAEFEDTRADELEVLQSMYTEDELRTPNADDPFTFTCASTPIRPTRPTRPSRASWRACYHRGRPARVDVRSAARGGDARAARRDMLDFLSRRARTCNARTPSPTRCACSRPRRWTREHAADYALPAAAAAAPGAGAGGLAAGARVARARRADARVVLARLDTPSRTRTARGRTASQVMVASVPHSRASAASPSPGAASRASRAGSSPRARSATSRRSWCQMRTEFFETPTRAAASSPPFCRSAGLARRVCERERYARCRRRDAAARGRRAPRGRARGGRRGRVHSMGGPSISSAISARGRGPQRGRRRVRARDPGAAGAAAPRAP